MSNNFELFDILNALDYSAEKINEKQKCKHESIITDSGVQICEHCGLELNAREDEDTDDWKYYGINDSSNSVDPGRCYIRKAKEKVIYQDVEHLNISNYIKDIANNIYIEACKSRLRRGVARKGIVFACVFNAYKIDNNPQSYPVMVQTFGISSKSAHSGLKFINQNSPRNSVVRHTYITPEHIIKEFLRKFEVSQDKCEEMIQVYNFVKNKSTLLNGSKPQSVASGIIWYWLRFNGKNVSIKEFVNKVHLSELTVTRNAKEIARLHNRSDII
jgi:transcription initiation factor TFIIIB Brf1 subunit/transcription initiation factor TFIIB